MQDWNTLSLVHPDASKESPNFVCQLIGEPLHHLSTIGIDSFLTWELWFQCLVQGGGSRSDEPARWKYVEGRTHLLSGMRMNEHHTRCPARLRYIYDRSRL